MNDREIALRLSHIARELGGLAGDILQSQHSSQIVKHDSAFQMAVNIQRFYQVHWMNEGKEEA